MSDEIKSIMCKSCGEDITYSSNSVDYILQVKSIRIYGAPGFPVTDMNIEPDPKWPIYFCSKRCIRNYYGG